MSHQHGASDLSDAALGGPICISNGQFVDNYGRVLSLRGLNVSGASKLPTTPNGLSHLTDGFYDQHRTVTFIGRPFPLEEADLHFRRLQAWGLPFIRLLVTWESIAHAGPDPNEDLDNDYIAYLKELIKLMPEYGIRCFVCNHQDVWSRFSGGSGAPAWTFEAAGLDIESFTDTGAAYVHGQDELKRASGPINPKEPSGPFLWPSGYQKLAASTMATLFWAGDAMAPKLKCLRRSMDFTRREEEVSIQSFLQDSLVEAFGRLSDEIGDLEACMGFEPMNEPHPGLLNLHGFHGWNYDTDLHIGHFPTLAQSLALGSGYAQDVDFYVKSWPFPTKISHRSRLDPKGRSAWLDSDGTAQINRPRGLGECVWKAHEVWRWDEEKKTARIIDKEYFHFDHRDGREDQRIEWYKDCYAPFVKKFSDRVSRKWPNNISFVEPLPNEFMPPWPEKGVDDTAKPIKQTYAKKTAMPISHTQNLVYAPHFYDLNVLFGKVHGWMSVNVQGLARKMFVLKALYWGGEGLKKNYAKQIGNIVRFGTISIRPRVPTIIGEIGIPWDINNAHAYQTGDYDKQRQLMDALIAGMESAQVGFTLWNYNPNNKVEYGDGWNKEDFSVINGDEIKEISGEGPLCLDYRNAEHEKDELYRGGRALDVIIRPYAAKTAGQPVFSSWDPRTLRFECRWTSEISSSKSKTGATTDIFLPEYHYAGHEIKVETNGPWKHDRAKQTLYVQNDGVTITDRRLVITIQDENDHLLRRARQRREALGSSFPLKLLPLEIDAWWEMLTIRQILGILVLVVAFLIPVIHGIIAGRT